MPNQVVSLNTAVSPYEADLAQIAQRQKLADLLMNQSAQPEERFSYNGIQAVNPPTAGLTKILQGLTAGYAQRKNIEDQRALSQKAQADASDWITKLTQGTPATPEVPGSVAATPADVEDRQQGIDMGSGAQPMTSGQSIPTPGGMGEGDTVGSPAIPGHATTDAERMALLMKGASNPITSSFAGPMLMQEVQRQRLLAALGAASAAPSAPATPASPAAPGASPAPSGMPMPGGAPSAGTPMPGGGAASVQQQTSIGGPAGGIPMSVWLATDPSGKAYMDQLAKDNAPVSTRYGIFTRDPNNRNQFLPAGGAMPANALPYHMGPNGQVDVSPYPGQVQGAAAMAGATAGAQAGAKFPYQTVTTPTGAQVPAFTVPGLVRGAPGAPSPATPSGAPAAGPTASPSPPTPPTAAPMPPQKPGVGQTTTDKTYGEDAGKAAVEYENNVNNAASGAVSQNRMLDELTNNLKDMNPGKLAAIQKSIAEWKVAVGMGDDNDKRIAASSEVTDKITGQLVSSALKSMTARPTQSEFQIFLSKFVPNMEMTPQGANAVIGFMRQQNNLNLQKQQAFQAFKKTTTPDHYRDFETQWNQQVAGSPLSSAGSFGAPPTNTPAIDPDAATAELRRRGVIK